MQTGLSYPQCYYKPSRFELKRTTSVEESCGRCANWDNGKGKRGQCVIEFEDGVLRSEHRNSVVAEEQLCMFNPSRFKLKEPTK